MYGLVENGGVRLEDGMLVRADTEGATGRVAIGVRPEKVKLGSGGENTIPGTVREAAYIGVATEIVVETAAGDLTVFHQNAEAGGLVPAVGSPVTVTWSAASTFVVDRPQEEENE